MLRCSFPPQSEVGGHRQPRSPMRAILDAGDFGICRARKTCNAGSPHRALGPCGRTSSAPGSASRAWSWPWEGESACWQTSSIQFAYNSGNALKACSAAAGLRASSRLRCQAKFDGGCCSTRLDMGTAAASERHQFRMRAQWPKDANHAACRRGIADQTNSGGLLVS
jgi:hypothetical protein